MWNSTEDEVEQTKISAETLQLLRLLTIFGQPGEVPLVQRYTVDYLLSLLDRNRISMIERSYRPYEDLGMDVVDFLRVMLGAVEHSDNHTFYLAMAVIELFREVASSCGSNDKIRFDHFTDFICRRVLDEKAGDFANKKKLVRVRQRVLPIERICEAEASPPTIHGNLEENILKLGRQVVVRDRSKHTGQIKRGFYAASLKKILALDSRADFINVYDLNCRPVTKIVPAVSLLKRDIVVLNFAYSKRQERLGAVLENFTMSFWDLCEEKSFEKSFSTVEQCQECQLDIWFLECQCLWLTADPSGLLTSWDLDLECVQKQLQLKNRGLITALCELPSLNLIALAQEGNYHDMDQTKRKRDLDQAVIGVYNIQRKSLVVEIEVVGSRGGLHTLWFSTEYQVLLAAGYDSTMSIYEIDPTYFDATLKGKLIGHESLIVTFIAIDDTPMVVSCDDRQKLKVWDLRSYKCLQTVDFFGRAAIRGLVSLLDDGKIALLGNRIQLLTLDCEGGRNRHLKTTSLVSAMRIDFDQQLHELLVFTKHDLRLYDIRTGRIKHIFAGYVRSEEEPSAYKYIHDGKLFAVGMCGGGLRLFSKETGLQVSQLQPHNGDVSSIAYDAANRMFMSAGWDSNVLIQRQGKMKPLAFERIRHIRDNFGKKEVTLMEVSIYHGLIAVACQRDSTVLLWDYTTAKLLLIVKLALNAEPTALAFINGVGMLLIADSSPRLLAVQFERKLNKLRGDVWLNVPLRDFSVNHLLVDICTAYKKSQITIEKCLFYLAQTNGRIGEMDLSKELSRLAIEPSRSPNDNAERQINESYLNEFNKQFYGTVETDKQLARDQPSYELRWFQAHREQLTCMSFLECTKKYLATASADGHLKIWLDRQLLCDTSLSVSFLRIQMPLPYCWQLQPDSQAEQREKMLLTLRVIDRMLKKYSNEITIGEYRSIRVDQFLKELAQRTTFVTQPVVSRQPPPKIVLLQDEFTRKDLQYEKIRKYDFRGVAGPSLKEMEVKGRMRSIQRTLNQQQLRKSSDFDEDKFLKANKQTERKELLDFLATPQDTEKELDLQFQRYTETKQQLPKDGEVGMTETRSLSKGKLMLCRIRPKKSHRAFKQFQHYYQEKKENKENLPKPISASLNTSALRKSESQLRISTTPLTTRDRKKRFTWVLSQLKRDAFRAKNTSKSGDFEEIPNTTPQTYEDNCEAQHIRVQARTGRL